MPLTIVSLSLSAIFFVLFVLVELYVAAEPFAPGHIIFNRTFFSLYCCNFFSFGGWFAVLFYIPLYFQAVDGVSASGAGLRLLPSILSGATGSILAGLIMKWTGKYYWLTIAAYSSLTSGCFLIYFFSGGVMTSTIGMIVGMVMSAFGNGTGVTSTLIGLSEFCVCHAKSPVTNVFPVSNSTMEDQAVVTACSYLFRSLGSVIGISLSSGLVQQLLRGRLQSDLHDSKNIDEIVNGVRESLNYINKLDPEIAKIVRNCYAWATNKGFSFLTVVVFFALFSACFMNEAKLKR
jgi:hypothetical protein